jgi:hypothetical protein
MILLLAVALGTLLWTAATCFPRTCDTSANCLKSCRCEDKSRDEIVDCPLFFMCNTESGTCEDSYNMSCDEFCGTFAARGACGSKRCDDEADCDRKSVCQTEGPPDQQSAFECEIRFECDIEGAGVCSAGYGLDDATFCSQFGSACLAAQATP